jgi:hypothetical protein
MTVASWFFFPFFGTTTASGTTMAMMMARRTATATAMNHGRFQTGFCVLGLSDEWTEGLEDPFQPLKCEGRSTWDAIMVYTEMKTGVVRHFLDLDRISRTLTEGSTKRPRFKGRKTCKPSHTAVGRLKITNGVTFPGVQLKHARACEHEARLPPHPCAQATESYPFCASAHADLMLSRLV